jgi:hypothetical protein
MKHMEPVSRKISKQLDKEVRNLMGEHVYESVSQQINSFVFYQIWGQVDTQILEQLYRQSLNNYIVGQKKTK